MDAIHQQHTPAAPIELTEAELDLVAAGEGVTTYSPNPPDMGNVAEANLAGLFAQLQEAPLAVAAALVIYEHNQRPV
jgi:hypothetical protein